MFCKFFSRDSHTHQPNLLHLPDTCLIAILQRIPLSNLLEVCLVCRRFNQIKLAVCAAKRRLTIGPTETTLSINVIFGNERDLIEFFELDLSHSPSTLNLPQFDSLGQVWRQCRMKLDMLTFERLDQLAVIFPNITHLNAFLLDFHPMSNARNEELVRNLASLLGKWRLTSLVLCLNRPFVDQSLIACIGNQLTRLRTLKVELGARRNSVHITNLLPLVLNRVQLLHLGPVTQVDQLMLLADAFREARCSVQNWSMSYDGVIFLEPDHIHDQNRAFDLSLRRLRFTYDGHLDVLQQIAARFSTIEQLQLRVRDITNFEDFVPLHFGNLIHSVRQLNQLQSLKISVPYYPAAPFIPSMIELPDRWGAHRQPVIANQRLHTLKQLQINVGHSRTLHRLKTHRWARFSDRVTNLLYNTRIHSHLRDHCPGAQILVNRTFFVNHVLPGTLIVKCWFGTIILEVIIFLVTGLIVIIGGAAFFELLCHFVDKKHLH